LTGRAVIFCVGSIALLLLDSCATSYRPLKNGAGYSEAAIGPDEFRVGFQGNGETSLERAYDFALLRAAQVAREHGFLHFAVVDTENTSSARDYVSLTRSYEQVSPYSAYGAMAPTGPPWVSPYGGLYPDNRFVLVQTVEPRTYFKPGVNLRIRCFKSKPEKPFTYDAPDLESTLRHKYGLR
jgi:hypothetical protein